MYRCTALNMALRYNCNLNIVYVHSVLSILSLPLVCQSIQNYNDVRIPNMPKTTFTKAFKSLKNL